LEKNFEEEDEDEEQKKRERVSESERPPKGAFLLD